MLSRFRTRGMDLFYYKREQTEKGLASSLNVTPCDLSFQDKAEALSVVMSHCGDVKNVKKQNNVLGQYTIQLGKYRGQTFLCKMETALCLQAGWWMPCGPKPSLRFPFRRINVFQGSSYVVSRR